jgi:IPT/TIG domain-containing protein
VLMKRSIFLICGFLFARLCVAGSSDAPEILRISPTSGAEGTRVEITGRNLQAVGHVLFGTTGADFKMISSEELVAIVPHRTATSAITVIRPQARASSPFPFVVLSDPRVPEEASYKAGYVNSTPAPEGFSSVLLWGIALADPRVPGFASATVEVAWTRLACWADGREVVLNDDHGSVRGGLYRRNPWFGSDVHEPMPLAFDAANHAAVLHVGKRPDKVWHFWPVSPRAAMPSGKLEGCTVKARVKVSAGALLQMGMDYWRNPTVGYGGGGNNHEAGASNWYFPSERWQDAEFTDLGGVKF